MEMQLDIDGNFNIIIQQQKKIRIDSDIIIFKNKLFIIISYKKRNKRNKKKKIN
jgi:hypothetical protein